MMRAVAVVGISGVGKSTFLRRAAQRLDFLHLHASQLIKDEKAFRQGLTASSEELRLGPVLDNQALLLHAFKRQAAGSSQPIVFDGHVLIDGANGVVTIPAIVFEALGLDAIVFLRADPERIHQQRSVDSRVRPNRSVGVIESHQLQALQLAKDISSQLSITFYEIDQSAIDFFVSILAAN